MSSRKKGNGNRRCECGESRGGKSGRRKLAKPGKREGPEDVSPVLKIPGEEPHDASWKCWGRFKRSKEKSAKKHAIAVVL